MKVQMFQMLIILAGIFLLNAIICSGLTCCIGNTTLLVNNETQTDQKVGDPCTNQGTSCKDVSCPAKTCTTHIVVHDTTCNETYDCQMMKPVCRLLYIEVAEDRDEPGTSGAVDKDIEATYYVEQACFENAYDDVTIGCEFHPKIFYTANTTRKVYQKECFCDADTCNENLVGVCLQTDPDLKGKDEKYTCWQQAGGNSKIIFRPEDKHIIRLSIFANLIISMYLFGRRL